MRLRVQVYLIVIWVTLLALASVEIQAQAPSTSPSPTAATRRVRSPNARTRKKSSAPAVAPGGIAKVRVSFNPAKKRDPMLSQDDLLLLEHREKQRLAALEAERKRKEAEERKRREEEERKRQWELMLLKDPSIVVRDKIKIGGIIDKEVLIGGKLYTIGNTYMGAKIVDVGPDSVTFSYKGHRFVKKLKL